MFNRRSSYDEYCSIKDFLNANLNLWNGNDFKSGGTCAHNFGPAMLKALLVDLRVDDGI